MSTLKKSPLLWFAAILLASLLGVAMGDFVLNNYVPYNLIGSVLFLFVALLLSGLLVTGKFKVTKWNRKLQLNVVQIGIMVVLAIGLGVFSGYAYLHTPAGDFTSILQTDVF